MKKQLFIMVFLASFLISQGKDGDFAVSKISPALLKNANAVVRLEEVDFTVVNLKQTVEKTHYVITILNENGDPLAEFEEYYDKLREINSVEGYLYDASGKQIKKIKYKDLQDISGTDDNSLAEDNRIKRHNFYYKVYPYTIEYFVEISYNHTMSFPIWLPQNGQNLAVEQDRFSVVCPSDYQFRYKSFNYNGQPVVTTEKNTRITTWMAKDLPALVKEVNGPYLHEIAIEVVTGPTDFQIGDYKGSMKSWEDYGRFFYILKEGRDILPDNIKQAVHNLTDGITDVRKKIRILYEYLQKNTRYISIQLGIGGWQPFDAGYVAKKGYGDCKALTNYMYSLLKEAGIRSNYSLIRSGEGANYMTDDFPSNQFDHVILSVPLDRDTIWLECTNQTLPAGYLGSFTADRYALVVDEHGSKLARTPKYGLKDNEEVRKIKAVLKPDASLEVTVGTLYKGLEQDEVYGMINSLSKDKVKEYLQKILDFPTYDLDKFEYHENKTMIPEVVENLNLFVSNYASITGKRLFINPNVMTRSYTKFKEDEERKYDIVLASEYRDIDSVEIEIPGGYETESFPQPVSIDTKFGKYSSKARLEGNRILYYRSMEQYSGSFPAKEYQAMVNFYETIYKADRNKIVFVKKEN